MRNILVPAVIAFVVAGVVSFLLAASGEPFSSSQLGMVDGRRRGARRARGLRHERQHGRAPRQRGRGQGGARRRRPMGAPRSSSIATRSSAAVGSSVMVDGAAIGQLRGRSFYRLDLAPGEHRLASSMKNAPTRRRRSGSPAGERLYLRVHLKTGLMAGKLQLETMPRAKPAAAHAPTCRLLLPQAAA